MDQTNPDHIYINIPAKPNFDDVALTDDQLEIVAGGGDPWYYYANPVYTGVKIAEWLLS